MELRYFPDPALTERARPIESIDESVAQAALEMLELMHEKNGIGLAGPQVGYGFRIFVMNPGGDGAADRVLINPEILETRGQSVGEEGCLSFPGLYAKIQRAEWIRYRYRTLAGGTEEQEAEGMEARAIQHECDHLDGILFVKRMSPAEKQSRSGQLRELERKWQARQAEAGGSRSRARARR